MFAPQVAKAQTKPASSPTSKLVPQRSTLAARPFGHGMVEQAHMLQQSISNQASLRLLAQRATSLTGDKRDGDCEQEIAPENMTALEAPRGVSWDFSRIPLFPVDRASDSQARHPRSGIIQPKLAVGEIDDPLEREADAVADHVMGMPDPAGPFIAAPSRLQRQCAACREDERTLRAKPSGADLAGGAEAPAQVHHLLRAPGEGLDAASRAFFEPRFGYDFADVRVHRGAAAAQSARALGALAYTVGRDIVFGADHAASGADERRLLAHELAHVVQQGGGARAEAAPSTGAPDAAGPASRRAAQRAVTGPLVQRQIFLEPPVEIPEIDIEELLQPGEGTSFEETPGGGEEFAPDTGEATPNTGEAAPDQGPAPDQSAPNTSPQPGPQPAPVPPVIPQPDDKQKDPCGSQRLPNTVVTSSLGPQGQAGTVLASPLTICPGPPPWRGSQATRRVYPAQDACLKAAPGGRDWFATHLLHGSTRRASAKQCNLHGPGNIPDNIILAHTGVNTRMAVWIERDALIRVCDLRQVLWYQAKVGQYFPGNEFFAKSIIVTYGLFDTSTGLPGPQIDSQTFDSTDTPPACPGGAPAIAPPVAPPPPIPAGDVRTFDLCDALNSQPFEVKEGGLTITLHSLWHRRRSAPAGTDCPPSTEYGVALDQEGTFFGWNQVTKMALPADKDVTLTWRKLESDNYRLRLFIMNPGSCCVRGHFTITRFAASRLKHGTREA